MPPIRGRRVILLKARSKGSSSSASTEQSAASKKGKKKSNNSRTGHSKTRRSSASRRRSRKTTSRSLSLDDSLDRGQAPDDQHSPLVIEMPVVDAGEIKTIVVIVDLLVNGHPVQARIPVRVASRPGRPDVKPLGLGIAAN